MTPTFSLAAGQLDGLSSFLDEVVGFFVIEERVQHASSIWYDSKALAEELWELAMDRTRALFSHQLSQCSDRAQLVSIRPRAVRFCAALARLPYNPAAVTAILCNLCTRYAEMLSGKAAAAIEAAVKSDSKRQAAAATEEELEMFRRDGLVGAEAGCARANQVKVLTHESRKTLPVTMAFSAAVPLCCDELYRVINDFYAFMEGFPPNMQEFDDIFREVCLIFSSYFNANINLLILGA